MAEWKYFEFSEPRPDPVLVFTEKNRRQMEKAVAEQVALLLSTYGEIDETDVDTSGQVEAEDPIPYVILSLDEEPLEDDGTFSVSQMPLVGSSWDVSTGVYAIRHEDESGRPVRSIAVHDPSHEGTPLLYDQSREPIDLEVLQELYDALAILTRRYLANESQNDPPHQPHLYPQLVSEIDFDGIEAHLSGLD